jgi:hypothetical protein
MEEPEYHDLSYYQPPPVEPAVYNDVYEQAEASLSHQHQYQEDQHPHQLDRSFQDPSLITIPVPLDWILDIHNPHTQKRLQKRAAASIGQDWPAYIAAYRTVQSQGSGHKRRRLDSDINNFYPSPEEMGNQEEQTSAAFSHPGNGSNGDDATRRSFPAMSFGEGAFSSLWSAAQLSDCLPCFTSHGSPREFFR